MGYWENQKYRQFSIIKHMERTFTIVVKDAKTYRKKILSYKSEYTLAWFVAALDDLLKDQEWISW
jgi:hypothetical protein